MTSRIRSFLAELKRRKVVRVALVYVIVGFAVIEGGQLIFDALEFPRAAWQFVVVLTLLGFPIALVLAWALELTPEGVRVTPPVEQPEAGWSSPRSSAVVPPYKLVTENVPPPAVKSVNSIPSPVALIRACNRAGSAELMV